MKTNLLATFVSLGSIVAASGLAGSSSVTPSGPVAFVDVNVIPMDRDCQLVGQTVLVEGGRIVAVDR